MEIIMIFNNILPTERAHGLQIVKMCEAFADNGLKVTLLIPKNRHADPEEIFGYYNIKRNFTIKSLKCLNFRNNYRLRYISFAFRLLFFKLNKQAVIITRHPEIVFVLARLGKKVVYELHNWVENSKRKTIFLTKNSFFIIATTKLIKDQFVANRVSEDKILVAPNGVDLGQINLEINQTESRKKLNLSLDKKIVLYSGHLYKSKGVYTIAEAARFLPESFEVIFVGGLKSDVEKLTDMFKNYKNIKFLGQKNHAEIPYYLKAADYLVIANSARDEVEKNYTSPLKLFEYMAAGKVIIASDVPALREFLNEERAIFFTADNPESLAKEIKLIDNNLIKKNKLIADCLNYIQEFTWGKRAETIIKRINN